MIVGPSLGSPTFASPMVFYGGNQVGPTARIVGPGGEPPKSVRLIGRYCLLAEPLCKQGKIQSPVGLHLVW